MFEFAQNILEVAVGGLSEFVNGASEGLLPAAINTIKKHFKSTDTLRQYYNESVKRSVLSLEIALKGPRAYYPTREKEFYQKHFAAFERNVFHPFSRRAVSRGMVKNEEELRDRCIQECDSLKGLSQRIFGLPGVKKDPVEGLLEAVGRVDPRLSQKMLESLQKIPCHFLPPLLEQENVLLSGIVFHFHAFLQSDPNFSSYMGYLEVSELKKGMATLQAQLQTKSQDFQLQSRIDRLEQTIAHLSAYPKNMGEIGKKLDNIYEKTIEIYDVLHRLEAEMKSRFSGVENRLEMIVSMLQQGASPSLQSPVPVPAILHDFAPSPEMLPVLETKDERERPMTKGEEAKRESVPKTVEGPKGEKPEVLKPAYVMPSGPPDWASKALEVEKAKRVQGISFPQGQSTAPKHKHNVLPGGSCFSMDATQEEKESESPPKIGVPAISPVFLGQCAETTGPQEMAQSDEPQEMAQSDEPQEMAQSDDPFSRYLSLYSTFLRQSDAPGGNRPPEEKIETAVEEKTPSREESSGGEEKPACVPPQAPMETKKSKRIKADRISSAFGNPE